MAPMTVDQWDAMRSAAVADPSREERLRRKAVKLGIVLVPPLVTHTAPGTITQEPGAIARAAPVVIPGMSETTTGIKDAHLDAEWRTCPHRGNKVRELSAGSCGCGGLDRGVYECGLGGLCMKQRATTLQREETIKAGIKLCDECTLIRTE